MEPVDPNTDQCNNYYRVIQKPMDLGTLNNRVYLDNYRNFKSFWIDLGLIFSNCRHFNKDESSDIRILADTLREYSRHLYTLWYKMQKDRYHEVIREVEEKRESIAKELHEKRKEIEDKIASEVAQFLERFFSSVKTGVDFIRSGDYSQAEKYKAAAIKEVTYNTGVFSDDRQLISAIFMQIEEIFKPQEELVFIEELLDRLKNRVELASQAAIPNIVMKKTEIILKTSSLILSESEIEMYNPGDMDWGWLQDPGSSDDPTEEEIIYFTEDELEEIKLEPVQDKLYLVKWRNMSYLEATWEFESEIDNPTKINEFKLFNRAIVKDIRMNYSSQLGRHRHLLDIKSNARKRAKMTQQNIDDIYAKLFMYKYKEMHPLFQYTAQTQPIFRDRKLLRPYQLLGVNWLIESWYNGRNVILADEMGLGKTIQTVAFLNYLTTLVQMKGPFLVVAPLSTLEHWKRTVESWSNMNCVLYYDTKGINGRKACRAYEWFYTDISIRGAVLQSAEICKFNVIITSFEVFLQDMNNVLINLPFQHIVIDEAHKLKNKDTKLFGALRKMACKRWLLLTGTPIQNNTLELWALFNFIEPDKFSSPQEFQGQFGDLSNMEQVEKLHRMLRPYLLRRMKEDVESSIPPLQETIIDVEMTTIQKTIYRAIYERNRGLLVKGSGITLTTSLNNMEMQLRKCCNHPFLMKEIELELTSECRKKEEYFHQMVDSSGKMILLEKLLEKMKQDKKKVLIFSQFTMMLDLLEHYLKFKEYKYEKIHGTIKAKERQSAIDRFNDPGLERDVFLLSTKAGGIGINLTSASTVVIFDSDWNPQNDVQATARAHRIGQVSEVKVYRLITKKTYEAEMFEKACKKLGLDQAIFMGGAFHSTKEGEISEKSKNLKKEDLEVILKKGIIGLIEQNEEEDENSLKNRNIDEILQDSRVAKYSVLNGTYTYSKSSFAAQNTDSHIQVDDPNFWNIVFKSTESESLKMLNEFKGFLKSNHLSDVEHQRIFMIRVYNIVQRLIESKIKLEGYSTEDEANLNEILMQIADHADFNNEYKDLALLMSSEIIKPSRRFKNIDISTLQASKGHRRAIVINKYEDEAEDALYGDSGSEKAVSNHAISDHALSDNEEDIEMKLLQEKSGISYLKRSHCSVCLRRKCSILCSGYCRRAFHKHCLELIEKHGVSIRSGEHYKDDIEEYSMSEKEIADKFKEGFVCYDCTNLQADCFKCDEKGEVDTDEISWKEQAHKKPSMNQGTVLQCKKCLHLYHRRCLHRTKSNIKSGYLHKCQQHFCHKCRLSSDKLYICMKCPVAVHSKCMKRAEMKIISGKQMLCHNHQWTASPAAPVDIDAKDETRSSRSTKDLKKDRDGRRSKKVSTLKARVPEKFDQVERSEPFLTYAELGVEDPLNIDYSLFPGNWCKYCGARFSSQFYSGPWGPKSLCKQHFDAHKKKELRIGKVEDQNPSAPYDMDQNTELAYLNSKQRRDTDKAPGNSKLAELAKLRPSKKFK